VLGLRGWRCLAWTERTEQTEKTEITEITEIWTHPEGAPQAKFSKTKWKQSWKPFEPIGLSQN
jgi:hypothetical protein